MKFILALALAGTAVPATANAAALSDAIRSDMPMLMELYRDLHAHPELSMQEIQTPKKLAPEMRKLGFSVTEHVGKTGLIAVLRNGPGPVLMLRADMDALPVKELTGLPFASKAVGKLPDGTETPVMHACGHDTHIAAWLGTARRLAALKDQWSGTLVMNLQSGEETGEGARAMLGDGLYTRFPKPNYVMAFHDSAILPAGMIGLTPGYTTASVDNVDVTVRGVGGHGASPQSTKDPIVIASRIVMALQTLVSREKNPLDPAVVTVGSFQAGNKHNVIPDEAKLQLTGPHLQARGAEAVARRDCADCPGRSDRGRRARRSHAGRHHSRRPAHARNAEYGDTRQPGACIVRPSFRLRIERRSWRRSWSARMWAGIGATISLSKGRFSGSAAYQRRNGTL
jgi:hippurate hydrolase